MKPGMMHRWSALLVYALLAAVLAGCGTGGIETMPSSTPPQTTIPTETTEPMETLPVDEDGYMLITDRIGVTSLKSDVDYPEELWPDLIAFMEERLFAHSAESARIYYVGPEDGTEKINDLGLSLYRVRYGIKKESRYQEGDAMLLFHRDDAGWTYLKYFVDFEISMMVEQGEVTQEEIDIYGGMTNAAMAVFWLEQSGHVPYLTHINKGLVDTMISNGGMQVERSGRSYDCYLDAYDRAQWEREVYAYKWMESDAGWAELINDVEYIKLSDDLGNYICVYDAERPALELCNTGEDPRCWIGTTKGMMPDEFYRSYLIQYFRESIGLEQFVVEAENYQEAMDKIGLELIPARHLNLDADNPYRALEVRLVEPVIDIGEVEEDKLDAAGMVHYAIRQEKLDIGPYGNVFEGDGELKGWLLMHTWFWVHQIEDGLWMCSEGAM